MKMFRFDPASHRADLQSRGFAHLKGVLTAEFVAHLADWHQSAMSRSDDESLKWRIAGKKRQFVFDFPQTETAHEFRAGMAGLTGIPEGDFTISERHLKVYDADANPFPAPHKDRAASHYSIGIPVDLAPGSSVCVFPDLAPGHNAEDHAVFITDRDDPEAARIYDTENAVLLNEKVGDLILFLGSALWHERVRAAGTAILYLKVNGRGEDPLGENLYDARTALAAE